MIHITEKQRFRAKHFTQNFLWIGKLEKISSPVQKGNISLQ